jgi:hypothetical protein
MCECVVVVGNEQLRNSNIAYLQNPVRYLWESPFALCSACCLRLCNLSIKLVDPLLTARELLLQCVHCQLFRLDYGLGLFELGAEF